MLLLPKGFQSPKMTHFEPNLCEATLPPIEILTYHFQVNWKVDFRLGVDLTHIHPWIFQAKRFYSQVPVISFGNVDDRESNVGCVHKSVWCQNCEILSSHPWNLKEFRKFGWNFLIYYKIVLIANAMSYCPISFVIHCTF